MGASDSGGVTRTDQSVRKLLEPSEQERCDTCRWPSVNLVKHGDDRLCESCRALFWAANVLLDNEIDDELKGVPTLAFAACAPEAPHLTLLKAEFLRAAKETDTWEEFRQRFVNMFNTLEAEKVVDEVAIVWQQPFYVRRHRRAEGDPVEEITIDMRYRPKKVEDLEQQYEVALREADISYQEEDRESGLYSAASFSHEVRPDLLRIVVRPRGPEMDTVGKLFERTQRRSGKQLPFPAPQYIGSHSEALIQRFGHVLRGRERGRPSKAETVIPACLAWYIGGRGALLENKGLRDGVVRALDKHFFDPLDREPLRSKSSNRAQHLWKSLERASTRISAVDNELRECSEVL